MQTPRRPARSVALLAAALLAVAVNLGRPPLVVAAQTSGYVPAPTLRQYGLRCEAAALSIALAAKGINVSQDWVQSREGTDARQPVMNAQQYPVRWGNPYTAFVGDVNGRMGFTGYGVYAGPIVAVARQAGAVAWGGENWNPRDLYAQLALGNPAVVWVPWSLAPPVVRTMQTWDGQTVWFSRQEHAQTLIGFDQNAGTVELSDPESGNYRTFSMALFETRFAQFHSTAVVVGRSTSRLAGNPGASQAVVAVRGGDDGVWAAPAGGDFNNRGGRVVAAPAVLHNIDGSILYLATGTDQALWVRSDAQAWRRLSTDLHTACYDNPAATDAGGVLSVVCEGTDRGAWMAQAPLRAGQLPQVGSFSSLGGVLDSGPAVAMVGGALTIAVNGTDAHVWTRTPGSAWARTGWSCLGHPALASSPVAGGLTAFACHGADNTVVYATAAGSIPSAATAASLSGRVNDGVGLAALTDGGFQLSAVADNFEVEVAQLPAAGPASGWVSLGGIAIGGTGSA